MLQGLRCQTLALVSSRIPALWEACVATEPSGLAQPVPRPELGSAGGRAGTGLTMSYRDDAFRGLPKNKGQTKLGE